MKVMNYSIVRCICAILVGVLLVAWSDAAAIYLVIAVGAMFLIPGLYAIINYLWKGRTQNMPFPLVSIGSGILGLWLMVMPAFFVSILMYVLGAILMFAGISQIVSLASAHNGLKFQWVIMWYLYCFWLQVLLYYLIRLL